MAPARSAASVIRGVFDHVAAETITPPLVQPAAPYFDLSGEDVRSRLVLLEDAGEARRCLRPDLTIPVCQAHVRRIADGLSAAAPAAYRYEGPVFRADPEGGAPLEITQFGLERFADPDPLAVEAQVFALTLEGVRAAGVRPAQVLVGDAGLYGAFVDGFALPAPMSERLKRAYANPTRGDGALSRASAPAAAPHPLAAAIADLPPEGAEAALRAVYGLSDIAHIGARPISAVAERLVMKARRAEAAQMDAGVLAAVQAFLAIEDAPEPALAAVARCARKAGVHLDGALEAWVKRLDALRAVGMPEHRAVLSMNFARQFEYYDGFVFELREPALGARPTLAGGGRYDGLAARLGAAQTLPAMGGMVRPDRVASAQRKGAA